MKKIASPSLDNHRRDSLTSQLVKELVQRIDSGEIKPGEQFPTERELMEAYMVSRTVVREAMSSLRTSGRIDIQQGRGAFVLAASPKFTFHIDQSELGTIQDVLLVMDLRIGLESESAALAALRRSPEQVEKIREALQKMEAGMNAADGSASSDVEFHLEIARATGNHYFTDLFSDLGPLMVPRARLNLFKNDPKSRAGYLQRLQEEHAQIYSAIARGDAEAARAAMRLHLSNSRERLKAAVSESKL